MCGWGWGGFMDVLKEQRAHRDTHLKHTFQFHLLQIRDCVSYVKTTSASVVTLLGAMLTLPFCSIKYCLLTRQHCILSL